MSNSKQSPAKNIVPAFALSSGLTFLFYLLQADIGISLADEGFLWYGTIATAGGQIPFRDFNSYDPGRYLWTAGWSFVLGDGIMALRLSTTIFKMIGLGFGLLALRRVISSWRGLLLAGLFLELWMFPRFKSFEHGLAMMAVYFCVWLIENPSPRRHFIVGIFVGLAAFFGRNHGLITFWRFLP